MKNTISDIQNLKKNPNPFSTVTVYDYPTSLIINETNIPMVLVGDSASMVVYGYNNTIPIAMEELILITKSVNRGIKKALIVADMPFMSYQPSTEEAIKNAGQLIKFGGADAIKLEGGNEYVNRISKIIESGIPVMGHVGLKPQSILIDSGYKIHGKKTIDAMKIYKDALALEQAGVFAIVLEGVPTELAKIITQKVNIPTIGIGAGNGCDGQIQVFHDLVGFFKSTIPKHAKKYINNYKIIKDALTNYCEEVENKNFPKQSNTVNMDSQELINLQKNIENI
jgi:3-methyl-2-oxobutanoate hydroxymethyltransferase